MCETCSICYEDMLKPYKLSCGHSFHKSCIIKCVCKLQIQNNVTHILVKKLSNISHLISDLNLNSRDFL